MMSNITTTSSKSLDDNDKPNNNKTKLITKLAENITRKQKHYENLSTKKVPFKGTKVNNIIGNETINDNNQKSYSGEEYMTANKLKRKTALSSSLISVTDSVNQEKRTCIEGVQLNCRGKLRLQENLDTNDKMESVTSHKEISSSSAPQPLQSLQLSQPPPLLSSSMSSSSLVPKCTTKVTAMSCANGVKMQLPPPRLKRQLQENIVTIQRLSALAEQLRLEVNELKVNLTNERSAVRVLRAQNESETRKWKTEVKKLQSTIESLKKGNISIVRKLENVEAEIINPINATSLVNMEIQRLTNEINSLKEANKVYEDKKLVNSDADKRKAADIRELKDSYEKQLSQIQKSAKNEITRLLEEIKSKERIIGQLKKDLKLLQNSYKISTHNDLNKSSSIISRNATTINHLTNKQQSQLQQLQQQQQQQQQQQHERMTCTAMTMIMPNLMSNQNKNGMKKMKSTTAVVAQNNHIKLTEQKNHVTKEKIISTTEDQNQRNQVQQLNEMKVSYNKCATLNQQKEYEKWN